MPLYEHIFLARQDISGQQVEGLVDQFKAIIEENGGSVGKVENWGLKSLSYRIRKNRKAHFTLLNIEAPSAAIAEMERQQRLSEDVLRSLTLRVEEHEEGPSAMMQKRDRDDRRGGRPPRDRDDRGERGDRPPRDRDDRGERGERSERREEQSAEGTA